eukprot:m.137553 g.137553  ORF g.137553 m.137553 type:complete len:90 (+) comp17000_c0_seq1:542-811(+)
MAALLVTLLMANRQRSSYCVTPQPVASNTKTMPLWLQNKTPTWSQKLAVMYCVTLVCTKEGVINKTMNINPDGGGNTLIPTPTDLWRCA